jgi:uncharacterized membrane protein YfcA
MNGWQLSILFVTGSAAGFVDAIAGGGGLITLPVLLGIGVDPQHALATSKLQGSFGSGSAAWHYAQAKTVSLRNCLVGASLAFAGAAIGALTVQKLDPSFLRRFIPMLLLSVAVYALLKPQIGAEDTPARMPRLWFDILFGFGWGFYDGFFGPGVGTFWTMSFVVALGYNLKSATASTKVMNFASNIGALLLFLRGGNVLYDAGLAMGIGQMLGARFGSQVVIHRGTRFIRPIFISVVLVLTAKLIYDAYLK